MPKNYKRPGSEDRTVQALIHLNQKIDTLDSRLDSVDKTLIRQEANLGEHMRRTELAEKAIDTLVGKVEPLEKHRAFVEGALKGIGIAATGVSLVAGLVKIFSFFVH